MGTYILMLFFVALLSFLAAALSGKVIIPFLRRLHIGQTISEYVKEHQSKANTPTIGGLIFIIPSVILTLAAAALLPFAGFSIDLDSWKRLLCSLVMVLALTAVGFLDDYIKVVKKRNVGLTEIQKTLLQAIIILVYLLSLSLFNITTTMLWIPFTEESVSLGVFWYPVMFVLIYLTVNAVNFTDGIDGLCASVTFVTLCFFLPVTFLMGTEEHSVLAAATAGGLLGFLVWNFYPAKVFMGDTGSMFLGGVFVALAFVINMPLIMLPVGIIYVIEMASDLIQIGMIKLTKGKKKVFKMAPIHHHYQLSGWSEIRIVITFSVITLLFCALSFAWFAFAYL